jgi:hypothetical protein
MCEVEGAIFERESESSRFVDLEASRLGYRLKSEDKACYRAIDGARRCLLDWIQRRRKKKRQFLKRAELQGKERSTVVGLYGQERLGR